MIRATTLLIVLSLTGTPTAMSLCIGWCDARTSLGAASANCHHQSMTITIASLVGGGHECDELLQGTPFIREDPRRVASESASDHALVAAQHRFRGADVVAAHEVLPTRWQLHLPESHPTVLRT